jgi:hypothetical protein
MASFPSLSGAQMAIGAIAPAVVYKLARPLLVEVIRAGYVVKDLTGDAASTVKDLTGDATSKFKSEFSKITEEAKATRQPRSTASDEITDLRAQVQTLQSQLAAKKA